MKKNIFLLSGLGADERVFQKLDFSEYNPVFLQWLSPIKNETIEEYAKRITEQITEENPIIIGLSFGGIMAIEIGKIIKTYKIILLASVKTSYELPPYYRFAGALGLHKILPIFALKRSNFISDWFFGAESHSEKTLLKQILEDTDPIFLKWAIDKIARWKNKTILTNVIHIHGTADRVLPIRFVRCDIFIPGGGHFMTLNKVKELEEVFEEYI